MQASAHQQHHDTARLRLATGNGETWLALSELEGDSASIDNAIRLAWLWLGGVLLPSAGIVLYAIGHFRY